jgi:PKD repeat protein
LQFGNGIDRNSELVLIDHLPTPRGSHNAGGIRFGPDGMLYISVGDGSNLAGYAPSPASLIGKILRIAPDGTIPSDNPYASLEGSRQCAPPDANTQDFESVCKEVWAKGLRNPFRFTFGKNQNNEDVMYINDVGWRNWEEINIGVAGADYGWPMREGFCETDSDLVGCYSGVMSDYTNPIFAYIHNNEHHCSAITGSAVIPANAWNSIYDNAYLFGDFACSSIFQLVKTSAGYESVVFADNIYPVISMGVGNYNNKIALYYTTYGTFGDKFGSVEGGAGLRRIIYHGDKNAPPIAKISTKQNYAPTAPGTISFDGSDSTDPNASPLRYDWDFGDGTQLLDQTTPKTEHIYQEKGIYMATLLVRDASGSVSQPVKQTVFIGNSPPVITLTSSSNNATYKVGELITLFATATDPDEGDLPNLQVSWQVFLHHVDISDVNFEHEHPLLAPISGKQLSFTMPKPEDLFAGYSYIDVRLTATDSEGLSSYRTYKLQPSRIAINLDSEPQGLKILVNDIEFKTPTQIVTWEKYNLTFNAPNIQKGATSILKFSQWESGADRVFTTTAQAPEMNIKAIYRCVPRECDIFLPLTINLVESEQSPPIIPPDEILP